MVGRSDIPDFPDVGYVAQIMIEHKKFKANNPSELKNNPEFQVFRLIGQNKILSTEEIQSRFESQSLSMILSNLQADNLITQTSDYRWKLNNQIINLIRDNLHKAQENEIKEQEHEQHQRLQVERDNKKSLYKRIADQLSGTTYVPAQYNVEDLFQVPELEILAIIFEEKKIGSDQIEARTKLESSVSLALSNLQADRLIEQTSDYKWKLTDSLHQEIDQLQYQMHPQPPDDSDEPISLGFDQTQAKIISSKQLLKAILDIDYFPNKKINEILELPEFEILNIINTYSPITSDEIEEKLTEETLLSLLLSNLSADDLITQTNDIRWVLTEDFRIRVSKVKVSQQEILDQLRTEQSQTTTQPVADTPQVNPVIREPASNLEIREPSETVIKQTPEKSSKLSNPIIDVLQKIGYIEKNATETGLADVPEYLILQLLAAKQPMSSDEIENSTNISSVSMTLSNLAADGLIEQRQADFKYELTDKLHLSQHFIDNLQYKLNTSATETSTISPVETEAKSEVVRTTMTHSSPTGNDNDVIKNLRIAAHKIGYIEDSTRPLQELLGVAEFEVLKIVGEKQPVDEAKIKELATSVSPVLISRTLSKLEAELRISRDSSGLWQYSKEFEHLLVEDVLKERKRMEELELARKEQERLKYEQESKEKRLKFVELLSAEGIIKENTDLNKLMDIPEFEVLWIISEHQGQMSEEEIKEKAESTSPVLVSRTMSMLEAKGRIQKTLSGKYELSSDLKGKQ